MNHQQKKYHFIGIGGVSMRTLADLTAFKGHLVSGTDVNESVDFQYPVQYFNNKGSNIPKDCDIVIFNNIVPENHPEMQEAKQRNLKVITRTEYLNEITSDRYKFLVTGTDGKTSTSFYLYQLCDLLKLDPFALLGTAVDTKYSYKIGQGDYIVEHNEGDLSNYIDQCDMLLFTNFDEKDHLWNFNHSKRLFLEKYQSLVHKAKKVVFNEDNCGILKVLNNMDIFNNNKFVSFGENAIGDSENSFKISNIEETIHKLTWNIIHNNQQYKVITELNGRFSAYNVTAAIAAIYNRYHIPLNQIICLTNNLRHAESRFEVCYKDEHRMVFNSMHGSGKSLAMTIDSLKKYEKPFKILINFNEDRSHYFKEEFYEAIKEHKFGTISKHLYNLPNCEIIKNQEDFNNFIDSHTGIVILCHAKYCFNRMMKKYCENKQYNWSPIFL